MSIEKGNQAAKILSDIIYKNGGCGPFGYCRPQVRNNRVYLTSQTATEIYEISEEGKVSLILTEAIIRSWQDDFGMDEEEVEEFIKENATDLDIIDLVEGRSELSWFSYLEDVDKEIKKLKELFNKN